MTLSRATHWLEHNEFEKLEGKHSYQFCRESEKNEEGFLLLPDGAKAENWTRTFINICMYKCRLVDRTFGKNVRCPAM